MGNEPFASIRPKVEAFGLLGRGKFFILFYSHLFSVTKRSKTFWLPGLFIFFYFYFLMCKLHPQPSQGR